MRKFQLEKYFDNDLYLVRFNNIQDLEKRFKEDQDYLKEGLNYYIEDVKRFGGINYEIYF